MLMLLEVDETRIHLHMDQINLLVAIMETFRERVAVCMECMDHRFSEEAVTLAHFTPLALMMEYAKQQVVNIDKTVIDDDNVGCPLPELLKMTELHRHHFETLKSDNVYSNTTEHEQKHLVDVSVQHSRARFVCLNMLNELPIDNDLCADGLI